jgi:hypothetical protein
VVEPVTTITAVSLLAMYLKGLSEEAGKRTAAGLDDGTRHGLRRLYETVKRRLSRDSYADETLSRVQAEPDNERRRRALQDVLDELVETDVDFARELAGAVADARRAAGDSIQIDNSGAVAVQGNVVMRGTNVAGRDLTIGGSDAG